MNIDKYALYKFLCEAMYSSKENLSDSGSDDIANMLGDADSLDAEILGLGKKTASQKKVISPKKLPPKKQVTFASQDKAQENAIKSSSSMDSLFPTKKSSSPQQSMTSSGLDDLFGPMPSRKPQTTDTPALNAAASSSSSRLDDLFGPAPSRRPPTAPGPGASTQQANVQKKETKRKPKNPMDWLGLGGNDSSEESDGAFSSAISKRKPLTGSGDPSPERVKERMETSKPQPKGDLQFLKKEEAPRAQSYQIQSSAPPPIQQTFDIDLQEQMRSLTSQQQDALKSLQDENSRLRLELQEIKKQNVEQIAEVVKEWKSKCDANKSDAVEEINKLREKNKRDLDNQLVDCQDSINRVKEVMGKELETATQAYQQTRSFHDLSSQMTSALDKLENVGAKVNDLQSKNEDILSFELKAKEDRVSQLQNRLETELSEVAMEKEKLHGLLAKLELSTSDQERLVGEDRRSFMEDRKRLDVEKEVFQTEKAKILERMRNSEEKVTDLKQSLFSEHQQMLQKLLLEQEKLQEERVAFQVHRDHDLARIRKEALVLEERCRAVDKAHSEALKSKENFEMRQTRLLELEQVLLDEKNEMESMKHELHMQSTRVKLKEQDIELSNKHLETIKKQAESRIEAETHRAESLKMEVMKKERILQERSEDMVAKQREFLRQYSKLAEEKRNYGRMNFQLEQPTQHELTGKSHAPEKPYDSPQPKSPALSRVGSVRSTLRSHLHTLAEIVHDQDNLVDNFAK